MCQAIIASRPLPPQPCVLLAPETRLLVELPTHAVTKVNLASLAKRVNMVLIQTDWFALIVKLGSLAYKVPLLEILT